MSTTILHRITKNVLEELNSFEISELSRVLEGLEIRHNILTGHKSSAEAFDISVDGTSIWIELDQEVRQNGKITNFKTCIKITKNTLKDMTMTLREKIEKITFN